MAKYDVLDGLIQSGASLSDFAYILNEIAKSIVQTTLTDCKENESDEVLSENNIVDANTNKEKNLHASKNLNNIQNFINSSTQCNTGNHSITFIVDKPKDCGTPHLGRKRKNEPKNDQTHGFDDVYNGKIKAIRKCHHEYGQEIIFIIFGKIINISLKNDAIKDLESIKKLLKTNMKEIYSSAEFRGINIENEISYKKAIEAKIKKNEKASNLLNVKFYEVLEKFVKNEFEKKELQFETWFSQYRKKEDIKKNLIQLIHEVRKEEEKEKGAKGSNKE